MSDNPTRLEQIEEQFLDVVLDKAPLWGLIGCIVLGLFIAAEQFVLAVTK